MEYNLSKLERIGFIILTLFCGFVFARQLLFHYGLIINPFPAELRESGLVLTTDLMIEGGNPFALENQPQYSNLYGIFYHIVVFPFAKIFGATFLIHRIIAAFFIFASCYVLFLMMYKKDIKPAYIFSAIIMFYALLLFPTTPFAGPHSLGLFLYLCCIFIPEKYNYSYRSLVISVIFGLLALYTKAYFVLGIFFLLPYIFLFVSKKKSLIYGLIFLILLTLSILVINSNFECYFSNTFFGHMNYAKATDLNHASNQFNLLFSTHWALLLIAFIVLYPVLLKKIKKGNVYNINLINGWIRENIDLFNINKPAFKVKFNLYLFCLICSFLICFFKLARHTGAFLYYIVQLNYAFFLVAIFILTRHSNKIRNLIFILLILINLNILYQFNNITINLEHSKWNKIKEYVSRSENILNSPLIAYMLNQQNKPFYSSGYSEYFRYGVDRKGIFSFFLPPRKDIEARNNQFKKNIFKSIEDKNFDLIMLSRESKWLYSRNIIQHYDIKEIINLYLPYSGQYWDLCVWEPK